MARRGENIYHRKDGRWEGRYKIGWNSEGKRKYGYIYGKSYSEVKQKMSEIDKDNLSKDILMKDLIDCWLRKKEGEVKISTYAVYNSVVSSHIGPHLSRLKLSQITSEKLQKLISLKLNSLSVKTVRDIITILKSIFFMAEAVYAVKNPMKEIKLPKNDFKEIDVLQYSASQKIVEAAMQKNDFSSLGILLCLYTGIRLGELCALKWGNICFDKGTVTINKTMQRIRNYDNASNRKTKIIIDTPKSRKSLRVIPLPDFLCVKLWEAGKGVNPEAYFLTGKSYKFIEPRNYQNYFKRYLKELNLKDVNFHILRHTFATRCIEVGMDVKSLSEILGHANINMTLNRYVHSSLEYRRKQIKKLTFLNNRIN